MPVTRSLPPPIRDSSGKTYIAIPAPAFVFTQNTSEKPRNLSNSPSYVYVEHKKGAPTSTPQKMFTAERVASPEVKPSIATWMTKHCSAEPPPGHVPWTGEALPSSLTLSISAASSISTVICLKDRNLASSLIANSSACSFELPSLNSGDTLLNGSLPSTSSSAWSASIVPPSISVVKASAKGPRVESTPAPRKFKTLSSAKPYKGPDARRYTVCVPNIPSRREAHVFNRRLTLDKIQKGGSTDTRENDNALTGNRVLSQIDQLDDFFAAGLKKMDSTMMHLDEEKDRLAAPSLVVSTSSAIRPVSIDSYEDVKCAAPPLAQRRGKKVPVALKIAAPKDLGPEALDYPDIPTPFRGSPDPMSGSFLDAPTYPKIVINPKMTAEQMISSLRKQVEDFVPKRRTSESSQDTFEDHCEDMETWLRDELETDPSKAEVAEELVLPKSKQVKGIAGRCEADLDTRKAKGDSLLPYMSPPSPRKVTNNACAKSPRIVQPTPKARVESFHASIVQPPSNSQKSSGVKSPIKLKPRKSSLSNGPSSIPGSAKKVRFSPVLPPSDLPLKCLFEAEAPQSTKVAARMSVSPKRKPAPPVGSLKSPSVRSSLPPTPSKAPLTRKTSPLNPSIYTGKISTPEQRPIAVPNAQRSLSKVPTISTSVGQPRCLSTGTPLKKGPLIFSDATNGTSPNDIGKEDANSLKSARPLSLGSSLKENRERTLTGKLADIAKRRSYAADTSKADKENARDSKLVALVSREAQKKTGRRSLPFQSVLSRLRG